METAAFRVLDAAFGFRMDYTLVDLEAAFPREEGLPLGKSELVSSQGGREVSPHMATPPERIACPSESFAPHSGRA